MAKMTSSDDNPHYRRCWDCCNVALHADSVVPHVLCAKCGSQDTRRVRPQEAALRNLLAYLVTAKQENTNEWMDGLAEHINLANDILCDSDRVRYVRSNVSGFLEIVQ